ncbi:hypothetical protein K0D36_004990 [Escherichia coli]|nr:hypothetical protein [Escherichia coli]
MTLTCHNDERVRVYVYFFPFDFSERVSFIQSECSYQRMKGNDSVVINGYGCPDLRFVDNSDRLYIIAHGNTDIIGDGMHGTKKLKPHELAKLLCKAGLTKNFVDVRLFSCELAP